MNTIKDFKHDDIVYWVTKDYYSNYYVTYGVIDCLSDSGAMIDLLSIYERRRVNGIPINEFESETKFKKLPKGWTWNTELFEITFDNFDKCMEDDYLSLTDAENVKRLLDKGILVRTREIFDGEIQAEITKKGYRIIKIYPMWRRVKQKSATTVPYYKLYHDFKSAEREAESLNAEIERQATLTDEEWSIEQIEHDIARYKKLYGVPDEEANKILNFLKSDKKVADIETRISGGGFQWKYCNNKKWNTINERDL